MRGKAVKLLRGGKLLSGRTMKKRKRAWRKLSHIERGKYRAQWEVKL